MIITVPDGPRKPTVDDFADITHATVVRIDQMSGAWEIEFASNLSPREQWQVRLRAASAGTPQDVMMERLLLAVVDSLQPVRDLKDATPTTLEEAGEAIRQLATVNLILMRLVLGEDSMPWDW